MINNIPPLGITIIILILLFCGYTLFNKYNNSENNDITEKSIKYKKKKKYSKLKYPCIEPHGIVKDIIGDRYRPDKLVYQIPLNEVFAKYPVLEKVWNEYKGLVSYGTNPEEQVVFAEKHIKQSPFLTEWKNEVQSYPDKKKYLLKEEESEPEDIVEKYNDVWHFKNGKYQHKLQDFSFPNYHWDKEMIKEMEKLDITARGNFYYQPGGFREWHTNHIHQMGWRMYFISSTNGTSWFNYVDPNTDKVHSMPDKDEYVNLFCVDPRYMLWHSIYSEANRFSLGFNQMTPEFLAELKELPEEKTEK
jgi:hypothetical protein